MNKSGQNQSSDDTSTPSKRYIIEHPIADCWIAHSAAYSGSGFILFNKLTGTFHAWFSEAAIHYPPLARAPYSSQEDCPVDEHYRPKSAFLMLLALRGRFKELMPGSEFVSYSARLRAFRRKREEIEGSTGKTLSESNWQECERIARSQERFEEYVATWLVTLIQSDDASKTLIRFGKWLEKAGDIENEVIPLQYTRFFTAVESAAQIVGGVPTQKAVREIYEKDLSANQLGKGDRFRSVMNQLHFEWLPPGGRGKSIPH